MTPEHSEFTAPKAAANTQRVGATSVTRALIAVVLGIAIGTLAAPSASAEPDNSQQDAGAAAAITACKTFSDAENYAASGYEDFADASAGSGNYVDYADPGVSDTNVAGRTALRQAAAVAMQASTTPDLSPDIAEPMKAWSLRVVKLLAIMGLHGGGNALNSAATDVNEQAQNVDIVCVPDAASS